MDKNDFIHVIRQTPLVSIDLVLRNERGDILLGYRRNRPARDCWFVPGGRIRKNEALHDALARIAQAELGVTLPTGRLLGAFDHFYADNFYDIPDLGTHYVVLAYQADLAADTRIVADDQHATLRWWTVDALLASAEVHDHTKRYFQAADASGFRCHDA